VVYDGVVGPWYRPAFVHSAGLDSVNYAILLPPLSVCLDRVRSRTAHDFADLGAAEHMWHDFERSLGGLERHVVNEVGDPTELARTVVQHVDDGTLHYPGTASSR
jgi:hypothetical protein